MWTFNNFSSHLFLAKLCNTNDFVVFVIICCFIVLIVNQRNSYDFIFFYLKKNNKKEYKKQGNDFFLNITIKGVFVKHKRCSKLQILLYFHIICLIFV